MRTFIASSQLAKLTTIKGSNMKDLLIARSKELAQEMGWTLERAKGYVDGETSHRSGLKLSAYYKVAMDDYSKGYRTGYYTQACSLSISKIRETLTAH